MTESAKAGTLRQQVLAMWPDAVCEKSEWIKPWTVVTADEHLGFGNTPAQAWKNAAERIEP